MNMISTIIRRSAHFSSACASHTIERDKNSLNLVIFNFSFLNLSKMPCGKFSVHLIILLITIVCVNNSLISWRSDRRPRIMGDKLPMRTIMPTKRKIQHNIVRYHNMFRTKVVPPASNMLKMKWHTGAENAAQKWADKCMFLTHDNVTGRHVDGYGACGQNIFVSSHQVPWLFAIQTWFLERQNFTYGSTKNDLKIVGHYTQMVWASTHEVGCGLQKCHKNGSVLGKTYYNYVCNYCPIGNRRMMVGRPYKKGKPCRLCKKFCHRNKLCTNSCPVADYWANCKQLHKVWPTWLCNTSTPKGQERLESCKATCQCKTKIHD